MKAQYILLGAAALFFMYKKSNEEGFSHQGNDDLLDTGIVTIDTSCKIVTTKTIDNKVYHYNQNGNIVFIKNLINGLIHNPNNTEFYEPVDTGIFRVFERRDAQQFAIYKHTLNTSNCTKFKDQAYILENCFITTHIDTQENGDVKHYNLIGQHIYTRHKANHGADYYTDIRGNVIVKRSDGVWFAQKSTTVNNQKVIEYDGAGNPVVLYYIHHSCDIEEVSNNSNNSVNFNPITATENDPKNIVYIPKK